MLMVFQALFALNNKYGGILKGCPPVKGSLKKAQPTCRPRNLGIQWSCPRNLVCSWDISLAVEPNIVGVAGANM